MKLQFKHQKFQTDAARAVVDVFQGQPYLTRPLPGVEDAGGTSKTLWPNPGIVPELTEERILRQLNVIQQANGILPSGRLEGRFNLTVEMETGVGKTYTYIKTIYELNKAYGWSKYLVVVPSIAIREGVYKSFQITQEHFAEEYGRKLRFFIYHSSRLAEIERFASDNAIHVMIINAQAFNAKGKDARRIYMQLDELGSRRPIDLIAGTNPIVILDEPQSVEGRQTKENLKHFHPLMTLRYSATHKSDSIYNMVYRLGAMEAYQKCLVKRIGVKGFRQNSTSPEEGYVYLESIILSGDEPMAVLQFDVREKRGTRKKSERVGLGFDLYERSGGVKAYQKGYVVKAIDSCEGSLEFANGRKLSVGDAAGRVSREQLLRLQIRETILSHIERERQLFPMGIKVLSLFFVDQVAHYREYDSAGRPKKGLFARMFEKEYRDIVDHLRKEKVDESYVKYLKAISAANTHAGYFSVDRRGQMVDRVAGDDRKNKLSNDSNAYDLIMRNKEELLDLDPFRSPVRFIFSHSALREGWDNPNVFQICTLKQSGSEIRKRQEVGRGLRLCVNQAGERMDANVLGEDVHQVNMLTVIASESYDSFARGLQEEMDEEAAASGYSSGSLRPDDARRVQVEPRMQREKWNSRAFQELWSRIRTKSSYRVEVDTEELVQGCISVLNRKLRIFQGPGNGDAVYDLVGRLSEETGFPRKIIIRILTGIEKEVFAWFGYHPEEFIRRAALLLNDQKGAVLGKHITYEALDAFYEREIFTEPILGGRLGANAIRTEKHLYDYLVYGSAQERAAALRLEADRRVAVYVKLPKGYTIPTPMGDFTPDWGIALEGEDGKYRYLVAETRDLAVQGQEGSEEPRDGGRISPGEALKLHCAGEHFRAVGRGEVVFGAAYD